MWGEFHISLLPIISGFGPTFHKLNPIILVLSSSLLHIPPKWCQLIKHKKKKSQWGTRNRNTTRWDAIEYRAEPANLSHVSPSCHDEGAARWLPTLNWCFNFLSDYNVPSIQFCYNNKRFYPKHTHFSILGRGVCVCVCVSERERKSLSIWHLYLCLSSHPTQYDRYDNNNNHERQQHSPSKNFGSLW